MSALFICMVCELMAQERSVQIGDARSSLPVSDCHLQDEVANEILRCLTAAARWRTSTEDMPCLSVRVQPLLP